MNSFRQRLTWARQEKNLTQEQLAKLAGVSQGTIGNLESGLRASARKLPQIAAVLGVDPLWLAEGDSIAAKRIRRDAPGNLPAGVHYDIVTADERTLLDLYRAASTRGRLIVMNAAERAEKASVVAALPYNKL